MVKTLHARAATSEKDFEEYEEESEPNMRFSHALIVVLVLHVLAVGGVFAFNSLKGRHPDRAKPAAAGQPASAPDVVTAPGKKSAATAREAAGSLPAAQSKAPAKSQPEADAATYTVVAGDTLKRIATSHKTSIEAIEQANAIDGKSVLHVGQALKLPTKSNAAKTPAKPETAAAKASEAKPLPVAKATEVKPAPAAKTSETKPAAPAAKASDVKPVAPAARNPAAKPVTAAKTAEAAAAPKPAAVEASKADKKTDASDKTYTVAKVDNPYAIAKKLKVSYNELIKANDIKDPTKLQIGQKLIIP